VNPKERVIAALELKQPDDIVPTFELEFQLTREFFDKDFKNLRDLSGKELDLAIGYNSELFIQIAETFDYSIIRTGDTRILRKLVQMGANKKYLLCGEADGTMSIPSGENMVNIAVRLFEDADAVKKGLDASVDNGIQSGKVQMDAGAECLTMCADYCFNVGPFLSPKMFSEFVTPYLHRLIEAHRENGAYVIKHTDGNIMPVLDQLVSCKPHALHSIDPQARVSLAEVKKLVGNKVCLAGNVNCGLLQTGTDDEVKADIMRSLKDGMPGGGYIFCTSNVAFKGMPPERYSVMMDMRKVYGRYDA
jgi:uroporphyrinogen decarboxylase